MAENEIEEELLEELYAWVDQIPLTRQKKDLRRDFSDGVLVAETLRHFFPKYVELHNYAGSSSRRQKTANWMLLNRKVFKKLGFEISSDVIDNITTCQPWAVEQFLMMLRRKIDRHLYETRRTNQKPGYQVQMNEQPEADQDMDGQDGEFSHLSPGRQYHAGTPKPIPPGNTSSGVNHQTGQTQATKPRTEKVSKVMVEQKEQEILAKEETIQILQAKVRRLEHLLHLKDIRIDDLQARLERVEVQTRPTANFKGK